MYDYNILNELDSKLTDNSTLYFKNHKDDPKFDQDDFLSRKNEYISLLNNFDSFLRNEVFFKTWLSNSQNYNIDMVQLALNIPMNQIDDTLNKYKIFEDYDVQDHKNVPYNGFYSEIQQKIKILKPHFESISLLLKVKLENHKDLENLCNEYLKISNLINQILL